MVRSIRTSQLKCPCGICCSHEQWECSSWHTFQALLFHWSAGVCCCCVLFLENLLGIPYWPIRWSFGLYPPLGSQACASMLASSGLLIWSFLPVFLMSFLEVQLVSQYALGNSLFLFCSSLCFLFACLLFVSPRLRSGIFSILGTYLPVNTQNVPTWPWNDLLSVCM